MKRGVLYVRSRFRERGEGGHSIEVQREAGARYFAEHNIGLVDVFEDSGESARMADRPNPQRMLHFVENGAGVDYVVVHRIDRMARNLEDYVMIRARLRDCGTMLVSVIKEFDQRQIGRNA